jgi:hypothetical protein
MEGFMKYAIEMTSVILNFIKTGSGVQKLMGGGGETKRQTRLRSHKLALGKWA